jgi:hypothetical protein
MTFINVSEFGGGFEPKPLKLYDILCLELKPDSPKIRRAIENLNLGTKNIIMKI